MSNSIVGAIAALILSAGFVDAQTKPLGVFDPGNRPPVWASFGTISDTVSDDRFREAAQLSEATGFKWLLQLGYWEHPITPIGPHAGRVLDRLRDTGLLPHVVALSVGEEWYEQWLSGEFTRYGLTPENPAGTAIIHHWMGLQHAAAKMALGVPAVWITNAVHPSLRPIPANTDVVAIDAYVWHGAFETHVEPIYRLAEQTTTLPLVMIPQWFEGHGFPRPRSSDVAKYFEWLKRPQWIALLGFTWRTRPNGLGGLEDMPEILAEIEGRK